MDNEKHPSDSTEQQLAHKEILSLKEGYNKLPGTSRIDN